MRNLLEQIKTRTNQLSKDNRSKFNTNDFLLEVLLNKTIERNDVIDLIIAKRIEVGGFDIETMKPKEVEELIDKLFKTSKNGLDTSVSDSQNNSSFSYNERYEDYSLIKTGSKLSIVKSKDDK